MTYSVSSRLSLKTTKTKGLIDDWTIDEVRLIVQLKKLIDCSW